MKINFDDPLWFKKYLDKVEECLAIQWEVMKRPDPVPPVISFLWSRKNNEIDPIPFDLPGYHNRWIKRLEHDPNAEPPLAAQIRAWPIQVEPETRKDSRILPYITNSIKREIFKNSDKALAVIAGRHEKPVQLSLFPEPKPHEVALLNLVDGTGQPIRTTGRGAPLISRLLVSSIIAIPQEVRQYETNFDFTLRDLVDAVYAGKWNRTLDWPRLRDAMRELRDLHIELKDRGTLWQPINVREIPNKDAKINAPIRFEIALPPGSTTGPTIDPKALAEAGKRSSPEWRAYIAAHSVIWIRGLTRVPTGSGDRFSWSKDVTRYPVLTIKDRKQLAFGNATGARSKEKLNAPWENIPGLITLTEQTDPKTGVKGWRFIPEPVAEKLQK